MPWERPPHSLTAKEIEEKYGVPRPMLQAWQRKDGVSNGPLYGKLMTAPGSAHTLYYPEEWVIERIKTWAGNRHKR